jgi:hypothetical protein
MRIFCKIRAKIGVPRSTVSKEIRDPGIQFLRRPGRPAQRSPATGRRRNARLARQRHVRDGDESPRSRIHCDLCPGRSRPARTAGRAVQLQGAVHAGRGTGQNAIVPLNLLGRKAQPATIDFVHTGSWSGKSIKEAGRYANVNVAASAEANGFTAVPPQDEWKLTPDAAYLHVCTNETIDGVEFNFVPTVQGRAIRRWWPTCPRTSCRARSTCRSTA